MADYNQGVPIEITDTFTAGGILTNPTLVTYTILGPDGVSTVYISGDPEVANPSVGEFILSLPPPGNPGSYAYSVVATGAVEAARNGAFYVIPDSAITDPDVDWAVVGPCQPWTSSQSVWDCCGQPMTTIGEGSDLEECPVDMTQFALEASQTLYELGGRQHSGNCQKTVIACEDRCGCGWQVLSRGYVVGPWGAYGWGWGGGWFSDCWICQCGCPSTLKLSGYPVREIIEIKIDDVVLDPADYLLYKRDKIARVDGGRWPSCDVICRQHTESANTITYRYGQDPPPVGIHAAAQLGCEIYKACAGQTCALPTGTTRVNRQGITFEKMAFQTWAYTSSRFARGGRASGWNTGLSLVDQYLNTYNPSGNKRRAILWAPGRGYARTVGQ